MLTVRIGNKNETERKNRKNVNAHVFAYYYVLCCLSFWFTLPKATMANQLAHQLRRMMKFS